MSVLDQGAKGPLRRMSIGHERFPYLDTGSGGPVLFLHGALADWRTWEPHCALLSKRFRCLSVSQRYFGETSWREDGPPFGVLTHAADLIAFVEGFGLGPVSVVAWSYAGHVALHATLIRPDLFSRILAYEPGVRTIPLQPEEQEKFGQDAQAMFGPIFGAAQGGDLEEAVRLLIDASGGPGHFDGLPANVRQVLLDNAGTMPLMLSQQEPPAMGCGDLGALPIPVTVAWGAKTRPVFKLPSQAVARCLPQGRHEEVPGVGHLWPIEDPQSFTAFVERWLDGGW